MIILRVCLLPLRCLLLTPPPLHNHLLSPHSSSSSLPNPPASPVLLLCLVLAPTATRCSGRGTLGLRRCSVAICATLTRPWQPPSSPHPPRSGQPWRYGTLVTWADVFKELRPWNSLHCIDVVLINTHKCYNVRIATISHRRTSGGDRSDRPNQPVRPVGTRSTRRPRTSNSGGTHRSSKI